ncbi:hypothetical protein HanRHA438_Chr17g0814771 [Helianthus annuus]|uniref:Uncharacterized protein n=1 Tax=Helianthus annuus TaxID=4232 RepID=A0A251VN86_HELAN|nr:hypothetical protein HanHA300_Chr17g0655801 [Helianthus annuus]KAJ0447674.1 hypothetical protein HanHA89_Chr17g0708001 [Helianthus annuus]KAJ0632575.1 hypothetical protein HanLR1_Chr17g0666631 [Helianthus annuus]KAJ0636489.1 hypothetical protein HanOQP8_Chr17g0662481 [Helianthus annuus]KAJ0667835.1 hypothetical protein HanPI659440_Chr17g0682161 [Helianthus annuus]
MHMNSFSIHKKEKIRSRTSTVVHRQGRRRRWRRHRFWRRMRRLRWVPFLQP